MASALRSFAQIPVRTKYFLWGTADISSGDVPVASAFSLDAGSYGVIGSMAIATAITGLADYDDGVTFSQRLLKDMGRQITIYDPTTKAHLAVYREVQVVSGAASEGVGGSTPEWDSTYFVKVWAANGQFVNVTRTG